MTQWTIKWSQWLTSIPRKINPNYDRTGLYSPINQTDPTIWFLTGTTNNETNIRTCIVPSGRAILVPIIYTLANKPSNETIDGFFERMASIMDRVTDLKFALNNLMLTREGLKNYRFVSGVFNVTLPKDNIFDMEAGDTQFGSDGYWVIIKPLPVGEHTIYSFGEMPGHRTEVTYNLTVLESNLYEKLLEEMKEKNYLEKKYLLKQYITPRVLPNESIFCWVKYEKSLPYDMTIIINHSAIFKLNG